MLRFSALVILSFMSFMSAGVAVAKALQARSLSVTPVITADAYADGDQIGTLTKLDNILASDYAAVHLKTIQVIDKAKAKDALKVLLFSYPVTPASADNAAVSVTDAEMASYFVGSVTVAAADFADMALNSYATKQPDLLAHGNSGNDLWMLIVCADAGGCDYEAVNDLAFRYTYYD